MAYVQTKATRYVVVVKMNVREATTADIPMAARVLAEAFDEYPWTRWSVPADRYRDRLEEVQAIYLTHALDCGLVLVDENRQGVAALLPPGATDLSDEKQKRVAELLADRLDVLMTITLPPRPPASWDLATIGVHPDSWGKGVGSAILAEGLRRLDETKDSVSLETSDPRNVALYSRYGFEIAAETQVTDGPMVVTMVRTPS